MATQCTWVRQGFEMLEAKVRPKPRSSDARGDQYGAPRKGDIPSRGVSHLPEQAEGHVLSVPLRTAEWELGGRRYEGVCRQGPRSDGSARSHARAPLLCGVEKGVSSREGHCR